MIDCPCDHDPDTTRALVTVLIDAAHRAGRVHTPGDPATIMLTVRVVMDLACLPLFLTTMATEGACALTAATGTVPAHDITFTPYGPPQDRVWTYRLNETGREQHAARLAALHPNEI